jgi:hypothetical protein
MCHRPLLIGHAEFDRELVCEGRNEVEGKGVKRT